MDETIDKCQLHVLDDEVVCPECGGDDVCMRATDCLTYSLKTDKGKIVTDGWNNDNDPCEFRTLCLDCGWEGTADNIDDD